MSIRDLTTILEGISESCVATHSLTMITEHVRTRLARQISNANLNEDGILVLLVLSPEWEQSFAEALIGQGEDKVLSMPPSKLQAFINDVRKTFEEFAMQGITPVLMTSPAIRPYVRSIIERFRPVTVVMSQNEIYPRVKIKTVGQV